MLSLIKRSFTDRAPARRYPDDPGTPPPTFRGMPTLLADRCRGTAACAAICPSQAIEVADVPDGWTWELDRARCVACGLCAEACPEGAIVIGSEFELAARTRPVLRTRVALNGARGDRT